NGRWQGESNILMMSVQKHEKVFVADFPSAFISFVQSLTGEQHSQAANRRIAPLVFAHLLAARTQPQQIFYICTLDREALRQQQGCQQIPLLFCAQSLNVNIFSRTLCSAIPAEIIVGAVAIFLAISFIVLIVVTHLILQREAIMRGDKINAGVGTPTAVPIKIAGTCKTVG